jgi:hypothetical protein
MVRSAAVLTAAIVLFLAPAAAWTADELVPGDLVLVKSASLVRFLAKSRPPLGDAPFTLPVAGSADDPTVNGATFSVTDVGLVAGSAQYLLGASGWRALGTPPGSRGYRYRGTYDTNPEETCRSVRLKDTLVKASCNANVPLSTPFADAATVVLGLGTDGTSMRYCAEFAGDEQQNDSLTMKRTSAPAPPACPVTECPDFFIPPVEVAGACWYQAPDTSCGAICNFVGLRYSEATRTFAGSDGTEANCDAVLAAFGGGGGATDADCESVGLSGLGCFVGTEFPLTARCVVPPTTAAASETGAIRACACR